MKLWRHLSGLNPAALWALFLLCVRCPWWVLPTIKATRECVATSNLIYGKEHHRNTPANAFRHALWNYNIARACYRGNDQINKVLLWAEKVTDWHEDFSKNSPLAMKMDLHNNRVGRSLFENQPNMMDEDVIGVLKLKAEASVKVIEIQEIELMDKSCFVHLKE